MKILFSSSFINHSSNGAAIFAQLFLVWANERNHCVHVISSERSDKTFIPLVENNAVFSKLPLIQQYHKSYIVYKTIEQQCKKEQYDFIFFNSLHESLHTSRFIKHTPVMAFLHDENFMKDYLGGRGLKRKMYRNFMKNMECKACAELRYIVTNSLYMKENITSIYRVHPLKVDYLYFRSYDLVGEKENGIVLNAGMHKTILFIKHDYARGGLIELIKAINAIERYSITLVVVGPTKSSHRELRSLFKQYALEIYEYQGREEIQQHYFNADLFCVPSHSEAMGIANFEAMFYQVPVVSSDIPVMVELNQQAESMRLVSHGEKGELSDAILEVLEGGNEVKMRIKNGHKFICEELNKGIVFNVIDRLIENGIK